MRVLLNIGLAIGATASVSAHVAEEILKANGFVISRTAIVQSDTEPTLVADVSFLPFTGRALGEAIYETATDLKQEAIGAWLPGFKKGRLIGPKADAWGEFDPALFFMLDGKRMSELQTAAA